ncbi:hypothetical protein [Olleya sp. Bg11-27]|uniref:hypothetical protein n=1 Tax=Olleya sp. Bg11-27 TaxID=2058135 RepID=UPI000C30EE9F|nr:hypothetical protein [Olleya sp. Bg11-27]AUC74270.1 hypothetical protein CW732_00675 [Olleya sp. Bg11-27]
MFQNCQKDDDLLTTKISSQTSYKRVSLNQVLKLKPIIESIKNISPIASNVDLRPGETFLGLDNVITDNIIQITDNNNVSTYTFTIDTNYKTTGYIENLHLIETGSNYIAYIIRYIPDYNWFNNLDNYTPEGDLVLDLSTFQGDKIKYSLEREVIWTTIPVDTARGGWIEVCTFSSVATCDYGTSIHDRGPRCGGSLGTRLVKSCSSAYTGSGSGWGNEGGDDTSNGGGYASNNNCEEVTGTLIQDSQPISGVDTGCAVNNITGVAVADLNLAISIIDCINGVGQTDGVTLSQNMIIWLYQNQENLGALNLFLINHNCTEEAQENIRDFLEILEKIPTAKPERYLKLLEIIDNDPWALIRNCAEQNGLDTSNYLDLYNLPFPAECSTRLDQLGQSSIFGGNPPYMHQPITDGNVPLANIDYYGVEVTNYPDFNDDGVDDSEAEIYQVFRDRFIDLASGEVEDFQFSCDIPGNSTDTADIAWEFVPLTDQDELDFVSNNPIASILLIESEAEGILPSIANDEGAVIVSEFTENDWTISTITSLYNGTQPFSGNRQWGWLINENGNLELFTRAVDVAKIANILNLAPGTDTECQQNSYYDIAEATWQNMQEEIAQWVNENGGQANIVTSTAARVDKEKIEELLTSNETIEEVNCD